MSQRLVLQVFEKYQKERVAFVTAVAEMATRPQVRFDVKGCPAIRGPRG